MREGFAPLKESLPPHAKNTSPYYGEGDKGGEVENNLSLSKLLQLAIMKEIYLGLR